MSWMTRLLLISVIFYGIHLVGLSIGLSGCGGANGTSRIILRGAVQ